MWCVTGPLKDENGEETGELGICRIYCGRWRCPACGPRRRNQLQKAMRKIAREMGLRRFLTLTLDPQTIPKSIHAEDHLKACFTRLRARWQKRYGKAGVSTSGDRASRIGRSHSPLVSRYLPGKNLRKVQAGGDPVSTSASKPVAGSEVRTGTFKDVANRK
jgi:hypothetical protein